MQLPDINLTLEVKKLKFAFWGVNNKELPKGVSQPKYSIA
jgi:hypothetical protein